MLYVRLDFEDSLAIVALSDSRAFISAIVETEQRIKQQAPTLSSQSKIFETQWQMAQTKPLLTLRLNENIDRANHRIALHET